MSTDYKLEKSISMTDVFDGRLKTLGVTEEVVVGKTSTEERCLTDGTNYIWIYGDENVELLSRYFPNNPGEILNAISKQFGTRIFSEYEPQFWGFDTQEAWDAEHEGLSLESEEQLYSQINNLIAGEDHDLQQGTFGMQWTLAARLLTNEDPSYLLPTNMQKLLDDARAFDEDLLRSKLSEADRGLSAVDCPF